MTAPTTNLPPATIQQLSPLRTLLSRILDFYAPHQIWLFGSRARGEFRPDSDWDLLVVVPDDTDDARMDPLATWKLQKASGVYADVVPCRAAEFQENRRVVNNLCYIAEQEGVLLYER